jgi:hypothetical protein
MVLRKRVKETELLVREGDFQLQILPKFVGMAQSRSQEKDPGEWNVRMRERGVKIEIERRERRMNSIEVSKEEEEGTQVLEVMWRLLSEALGWKESERVV